MSGRNYRELGGEPTQKRQWKLESLGLESANRGLSEEALADQPVDPDVDEPLDPDAGEPESAVERTTEEAAQARSLHHRRPEQ